MAYESPDEEFHREWAAATVAEAIRRVRSHFASPRLERSWRAFEARIVNPAVHAVDPTPTLALAEALGFRIPADVAAAVQHVRARFLLILREVVGETVDSAEDSRSEYEDLMALLT